MIESVEKDVYLNSKLLTINDSATHGLNSASLNPLNGLHIYLRHIYRNLCTHNADQTHRHTHRQNNTHKELPTVLQTKYKSSQLNTMLTVLRESFHHTGQRE